MKSAIHYFIELEKRVKKEVGLGLGIDSVQGTIFVPTENVDELPAKIKYILVSKKVTKKELESFVGSLVVKVLPADRIWIIGSSLIYWAQKYAQQRINNNLGLTSHRIIWHGIRRMVWFQLYPTIQKKLKNKNPPTILVIHCGGNDIGNPYHTLKGLQMFMKFTVVDISQLMPKTVIVWSRMLPRSNWTLCLSNKDGENWRTRINSALAKFVVKNTCGASIKYPDITNRHTCISLFRKDGVHLSDVGNELFINSLRNVLVLFLSSTDRFYPSY
ncbi:uncharacterized protein LOC125647435 [Ostrea edulis]|uniref:uncharacterized protein LOC125647435 n=1 Tax=Ostrea edulis TaxID=37623 RepID=UPI0024AFA7A5|nr:uncharacterized protein LOC125647435 [Ostrea edulis]